MFLSTFFLSLWYFAFALVVLYLKKTDKKFDIIFTDPPYDMKFHDQIAQIVFERKLLKEDGVLIIEHGRHTRLEQIPQFDEQHLN